MSETYVCAAPRCKGRRHRLDSLIGRAHLTWTVWEATR